MNRRVLLAICATCLVLAGAFGTVSCTGGASAGTPDTYSKLVGVGTVGPVGGNESYDTECISYSKPGLSGEYYYPQSSPVRCVPKQSV